MRVATMTAMAAAAFLMLAPQEASARDGELCWVRINQETIYGQKKDGLCRFEEIRIKGEKLKSGKPFRKDISEWAELRRQTAEKPRAAEVVTQ